MSNWSGFAQATSSTYSMRQWADDRSGGWFNADGSEVRWWEGPDFGVTFVPTSCDGAQVLPIRECEECTDCLPAAEPVEECIARVPGAVTFHPFWVQRKHKCHPAAVDPNNLYQRTRVELEALGWVQIARQFHLGLQSHATDLSGGAPTSSSEGIGTLLRNRGILGLSGGLLVVPAYVLPLLYEKNLVENVAGRLIGPGGVGVMTDPGFPVTGPAGVAPDVGGGFIYLMDQPPVVAFRDEADPGGKAWDWNDPAQRRLFHEEHGGGCTDCFEPKVRRRAQIAFNPCSLFAVQIGTC